MAQSRTERVNGREAAAREVIVKFKRTVTAPSLSIMSIDADAESQTPLSQSAPVFLIRSRSRAASVLLNALRSRADIEYVEPNYIVHTRATPNDSYFPSLWGMRNTGQTALGQPGVAGTDIGAASAWDVSTGSAANVVGVTDTGLDYNHPDLAGNVWSAPASFTVTVQGKTISCPAGSHGFNAITSSCDPSDDHNHGTHVSGTIGGSGNNTQGVTGVNWTTRIMGLKFLDSTGSGSTADAIALIDFAIQAKARFGDAANVRVLSASWGGTGYSQALADAIARAGNAEMLFVAAAGNEGTNNDADPEYPAGFALPNVLSVAAIDNRGALAGFSNYGASTVHLGAPGVSIYSTLKGSNYGWMSGTSMATPHVSGAAMLILSKCSVNTASLRSLILSNVDATPSLAGKTLSGGRLNVNKAIRACGGPPPAAAEAAFLKNDALTGGSWKTAYGAEGYSIANKGTQLPSYAQLSVASASSWTWAGSTAESRALQSPAAADRIASTWYSFTSFTYDLNLTDGKSHQVAMYVVDYDYANRVERVDVLDGSTGTVLDSRTLSLFSNGQYLVWNVKGRVLIRLTRLGPSNAVASGLFFGGAVSETSSARASFVRTDSATGGTWKGIYGRDGYQLNGDGQLKPSYATVTSANTLSWTWAGSSTDTRALQRVSSGRIAACWFNSNPFTFDVNITDGQTHQLSLYLVDWENNGRSERVDLVDAATGAVLDTRTATSFSGGQYLVWNVSGRVLIRVTRTGGVNGVVSGLFFN